MKYWCMSALSIYKYLESMSNQLDKIVLETGRGSNDIRLQKYQTTQYQTSKILELTERKRKMINLKVVIEDSLCKLSLLDRRILTLIFVDGLKSELLAQVLGVSIRTYFRKKKLALNHFKSMLETNGFNKEFFEKEYLNQAWFIAVYNDYISKTNKFNETLESSIIRRVFKEVGKIELAYNI